jgi:hypothetical protein
MKIRGFLKRPEPCYAKWCLKSGSKRRFCLSLMAADIPQSSRATQASNAAGFRTVIFGGPSSLSAAQDG